MSSGTFSEQTFAEKLSRLNNSAQCIETLSNWCIFHRKRAKQVVETWEKQFNSATKDQQVSYLYLANDILQNSKRKGGEFVNEFWKVLPKSLAHVYESGDDVGKKVVARLIGIWDERRVFGSRGRGLKDEILGDVPILVDNKPAKSSIPSSNPSSVPESNNSNPIKVVRKDSTTIRIKMTVGSMPEKIVTAYQAVLDEHSEEDIALNKCRTSVGVVEKIDRDISDGSTNGDQQGSFLAILQEQESVLDQCIKQLECTEKTRAILIDQLKEALNQEELKIESVYSQLQVARSESEHIFRLRQRLSSTLSTNGVSHGSGSANSVPLSSAFSGDIASVSMRPMSPQFQPAPPLAGLAGVSTSADDDKKKTAAEVAAKLTASSSSAQVLTSILSSLVAEEALKSKRTGNSITPGFPAEKRPKLENSTVDNSSVISSQVPQGQQQAGPAQAPAASMQLTSHNNQAPPMFAPPLPPMPPLAPPLMPQFGQNNGMMGMVPFGIMGGAVPPPSPMSMPVMFSRPGMPPLPPTTPPPQNQQQQPPQQQPPLPAQSQQQLPPLPPQQRPPTTAGFFQAPAAGFFSQMQPAPSVQRQ